MDLTGVYIEGFEIELAPVDKPLILMLCYDEALIVELLAVRHLREIMNWIKGMRLIIERDVPPASGSLLGYSRFAGCDCGCTPGFTLHRCRDSNLYGRVILATLKRKVIH